MEAQRSNQSNKKDILFPNSNRAQLVTPPAGTGAADIIAALEIEKPQALIIITGGAADLDEALKDRLVQLFSRGIARAAAEADALIMDGGTQSGVMEMMGQGVADRGRKSPLLGVAPAGKVTYPGGPADGSIEDGAPLDPNHSHFVLVDTSEWGGETDVMYDLAETLAQGIPAVTVLVNGGAIAKVEVLRGVRAGFPVVVVEGSGRLADDIAALRREKPAFIADAVLAEIVADGDVHLFPMNGSVEALKRLVVHQLQGDTTLRLAWERFALYDENAQRQRTFFNKLHLWILVLGVIATLLALTQKQLQGIGSPESTSLLIQSLHRVAELLHYPIVIVPIMISILLAAASKFKAGNKWVLLRGSAEAIKRDIYCYRARADIYSDAQTVQTSREAKLAHNIETISRQLMQTEVNLDALRPYEGPIPSKYGAAEGDDGLSLLTPDRYATVRLGDQLSFYRNRTNKLARQLKLYQWLIYIAGGVGTALAAFGLELWVAATAALVTAFTAYLEYQRVEDTLRQYNQVATDLANVQSWWMALSAEEQADQKKVDNLVKHTEKILQDELAGWVQQMQDALAELRKEPTPEETAPSDSRGQAQPAQVTQRTEERAGEPVSSDEGQTGVTDPTPSERADARGDS